MQRCHARAAVLVLAALLIVHEWKHQITRVDADIVSRTCVDGVPSRIHDVDAHGWFVGARASPLFGAQDVQNSQQNALDVANVYAQRAAQQVAVASTQQEHRKPRFQLNKTDSAIEVDLEPSVQSSFAPMGWVDPRLRGGRMVDFTLPGRGEPLNAIISGLSDPYILTTRGLLHYAQTIGFSTECLGIHIGTLHIANLGDSIPHTNSTLHTTGLPSSDDDPDADPFPHQGGNKTEQLLARQNFDWPLYGWPDYGTCWESLVGGNHFRAWKQDGAGARTGAWFLAVSKELWAGAHHDIQQDGYNAGREHLVMRALKPTRWSPISEGIWWKTEVVYNTTLLAPGKQGINHGIPQDGKVAILTVRRREGPPSYEELEAAWGQVARSSSSWDADHRADRRRGQWELQTVGVEGDVRIEQSRWTIRSWRWILGTLLRSWTIR
ncbi:hypothetical protein PIIN_07074 [Serendipita indica DSM 11827]|uniref:Uncharacterized protein n=1 Tax=Serendipita indica (strain DSM 11827) TaxID=1109443 RepID=G4TP80_SERID|nr:hypothetical protein PIIN_07074 [Serendipita indica DSM 11827]